MLKGLNHITVAVSNLENAWHFYVEVLGMKPHAKWNNGAYLSVGDLWFCLSCDKAQPSRDYTHIAFDIDAENFAAMRALLLAKDVTQWKQNKSEGDSLYILDPDGHKLEIHVGGLAKRLASLRHSPYDGLQLFD